MESVEITSTLETDTGWEFTVRVADYSYTVLLSDAYYEQLTAGSVPPENLIRRSFAFLLEREPVGSILPEFELPLINKYFPDFEATIKQQLDS